MKGKSDRVSPMLKIKRVGNKPPPNSLEVIRPFPYDEHPDPSHEPDRLGPHTSHQVTSTTARFQSTAAPTRSSATYS